MALSGGVEPAGCGGGAGLAPHLLAPEGRSGCRPESGCCSRPARSTARRASACTAPGSRPRPHPRPAGGGGAAGARARRPARHPAVRQVRCPTSTVREAEVPMCAGSLKLSLSTLGPNIGSTSAADARQTTCRGRGSGAPSCEHDGAPSGGAGRWASRWPSHASRRSRRWLLALARWRRHSRERLSSSQPRSWAAR